jgi:hypothetical protein
MTEQLDVPVPALVAACRLAQARSDIHTADWVGRLLNESAEAAVHDSNAKHAAALWRLTREGSSGAVLPLSVDPVTAAAAVISAAKAPSQPFRLFSEDSVVDLGYAEVSRQGVRYVDRLADEPDGRPPEHFPPMGVPTTWLHRLQAVDEDAPTACFAEDSGDRLRIRLDSNTSAGWGGRAKRLNLALLRVADGSPAHRRSLGSLAVSHPKGGGIEVRLTGEQQLEIHAAHFAGAILCADDLERLALFPVPSLDVGASPTKCRTTLPDLGCGGIPFVQVCVPITFELALHLGRLHWWLNPVKSAAEFALSGKLLSPATEPVVKHS